MASTLTTTDNRAASFVQQVLTQTKYELLLTARRGENILVTLIIPALLLIFAASLNIVPGLKGNPVDFLLPGIIAIAIIAAGMVNLGIATAYERYYGVLKRLGSSPISRGGLILAKIISILVLELVQVALLVGIAVLFYHWQPQGSLLLTLLFVALGTTAFAALGLAMAGALRAEFTLAGANALFLVFLLIGGGIVPLDRLPAPLAAISGILPSTALTQALQAAMSPSATFPLSQLLVLIVWVLVILFVAIKTFKWE